MGSEERRLDDIEERRLDDIEERRLDDIGERRLDDIGERRLDDIVERRLDDLPVFEDAVVPDVDAESWRLTVGGEVERPLSLSLAMLLEMPESELCAPFRCTSGWVVPDNTWRGVAMSDLLAMALPSASARYAVAAAAGYSVLVPRGSLQGGLVALWRNGRPLAPVHGFPARLVLPQSDCARSVKWLDSIVLTAEPVPTTGEETAAVRGAAAVRNS